MSGHYRASFPFLEYISHARSTRKTDKPTELLSVLFRVVEENDVLKTMGEFFWHSIEGFIFRRENPKKTAIVILNLRNNKNLIEERFILPRYIEKKAELLRKKGVETYLISYTDRTIVQNFLNYFDKKTAMKFWETDGIAIVVFENKGVTNVFSVKM